MNIYLTEYKAVNPHGELITMCGPRINANTLQEAQEIAGDEYEVIGRLIQEIDCTK